MVIFLAAEATPAAGNNNLWVVIIGAIATLITAFVVPSFTLRASSRAQSQQAQQVVLQQGNVLYDRLQKQLDEAEKERDESRREADAYRRERDTALDDLARLRHRVWAAGFDPEMIGRGSPPDARPPDDRPGV